MEEQTIPQQHLEETYKEDKEPLRPNPFDFRIIKNNQPKCFKKLVDWIERYGEVTTKLDIDTGELWIFSHLCERFSHEELVYFFDENNLIHEESFGLMKFNPMRLFYCIRNGEKGWKYSGIFYGSNELIAERLGKGTRYEERIISFFKMFEILEQMI